MHVWKFKCYLVLVVQLLSFIAKSNNMSSTCNRQVQHDMHQIRIASAFRDVYINALFPFV